MEPSPPLRPITAVPRQLLLITAVRLALAVLVLVLASVDPGAPAFDAELLAFLGGGLVGTLVVATDRRQLLVRRPDQEPLPPDAPIAPAWRVALDASLPSTVGLAVLSAIALGLEQAVLAAGLGGVLAGLGIASGRALWLRMQQEASSGVRIYREIGLRGREFTQPV
jgi:hypothetical protein